MGFFDRFKKTKPKQKERQIKPKLQEKQIQEKEVPQAKTTLKPKVGGIELKQEKSVKTSKVKKEDTKDAYKVLIRPLITEKATDLVAQNKYSFEVAAKTNKIEVKKAIQALYGVKPISVNIIKVRGKKVSYGRVSGKRKNWKKAVIALKPGDKIEVYEGV